MTDHYQDDFEPEGINTAYWADAVHDDGPLRIDPTSGAFWAYDSGVWREARRVVDERLPTKQGRYFRAGNIAHVSRYLYARLLQDGLTIRPDQPNTDYISIPSGLIEIATGDIHEHDGESEVQPLYQLQVEPDFDAPTPEFDVFLKSVLHDGDLDRVLDMLGYLLLPGNPSQLAFMFVGRGANGKSVLLKLIEAIIGTEYTAAVSLDEMGTRFAAADLYGKTLNVVADIDSGHIAKTGVFKQMTGGDLVRMDVKHGQAFKSRVWAVPVFSTNSVPTSADTSHGYLRRWEIVEFPHTFDGTDTTLLDRLLAELPGIAGKLIWHAISKPDPFSIRTSEPGEHAHAMFANKSDPVRTWLSETELTGFTERKDVYTDYKYWIEDGNGKTALTKGNFYSRVSAVLGDPKTVQGARGWDFTYRPAKSFAP